MIEQADTRHTEVRLVSWNPEWKNMFLREKAAIQDYVKEVGLEAEILHVGSTSIDHMISKPIIDILILIPDDADEEDYAAALSDHGIRWLGECGREGRIFMSADGEDISFYLHVTKRDNPVARDQLLFQKLEREDATVMCGYMCIKKTAAEMYPDDRAMYRLLKGYYIEGVLAAYRRAVRDERTDGQEKSRQEKTPEDSSDV